MNKRSLKMAAAASVLALALMAPSAFAQVPDPDGGLGGNFGSIVLEKNCSDPLSILDTTQCSYNIAAPKGYQDVDQKAFNTNLAVPIQSTDQFQLNKQDIDADVKNVAIQGPQIPVAVAVAKSGDSKAYGHDADVYLFAPQKADASVKGFQIVASKTGSADVIGSGNGNTTAIGGNTGNFQKAESEIEGKGALAIANDAIAPGGDGGNNYGASGGDVKDSSNGGWAVDATLGLAASVGGDGGTVGCCPDGVCCGDLEGSEGSACCPSTADGGNGGKAEVEGKAIGGDGGASTGGAGGTQTAGDGAAGGIATNIALAKNVGDGATSKAWNDATSGDSTMGDTNGNLIVGGNTGGNKTFGVMAGGSAANVLGVAVTQVGDVSSTSGDACQNGDPKAVAINKIDQSGVGSTVTATQDPVQRSKTTGTVTQDANSRQNADQTVSSDKQFAGGIADGSVIKVGQLNVFDGTPQ